MNILRQSTQIKVRVGPAVAVGDGFTPVTTLSLSTADEAELLKANGAATVDISGATMAAVTGCDGWYDLTLTSSHTDTVGELVVVIQDDSLILPIHKTFTVVVANTYDGLVTGTDWFQVDAHQIEGVDATDQITAAAGPRSIPEKNVAFTFDFKMVDATDFVTGETGLTVSAAVAQDGAAFAAAAGTVTEISNGWYQFAATTADMNANRVVFRFTAAGAAPTEIPITTDGGV